MNKLLRTSLTCNSQRNFVFSTLFLILLVVGASAQQSVVRFAKPTVYPSGGGWLYGIAVADVNGDGHPDIITANLCDSQWDCGDIKFATGKVGVLLGNGDGTFQPAVSYSSGGYNAYSVAVADVNGDGHPDLIVANNCATSDCNSGSIGVLLGNGDGTFQPAVGYNSGGNAMYVAVGDTRGNGRLDIVASTCLFAYGSSCEYGTGTLSVLLGNGDGTFQPAVMYSTGGPDAGSIAIGDLNRDGKGDVVLANDNDQVGVLLSNGDGTFQAAVSYTGPGPSALADVNGDGDLDIVGVGAVLLGNGDGTFQAQIEYPASGYAAAAGDLNGGAPDVAVATGMIRGRHSYGLVQALGGVGDGTFEAPVTYKDGCDNGGTFSIAIADLNGDNRGDVVGGNWGCDSVAVLLNILSVKSTIALRGSPNPSQLNESVTFTATISSNPPVPDGEVIAFYSGAKILGMGTTSGGIAALTTSFAQAKTYAIRAGFAGDPYHKPSTGRLKQVVNP